LFLQRVRCCVLWEFSCMCGMGRQSCWPTLEVGFFEKIPFKYFVLKRREFILKAFL